MTRRRTLLFVATGVAAGAIGGVVAWRRLATADANHPADQARALLDAQTFDDADGRPQPFAQWSDRVLVVNFWATWCAPCVEEMPELQHAQRSYERRGVTIVGVGIDSPANIREFRSKLGLDLPLLVAGAGGSELGRALGNRAGALPFTVLVDRQGRIRQRKLGQIRGAELKAWIEAAL
jgi:thiol-disulfide isomerase/thioredoxin